MADVVYLDPIDHVSGKISKKFRTVYNYRKASKRKYTQVRDARSTPPTAKEMALHTKFRTVALARNERAQDLMHITQDQAAYTEARKATGFKYTTFFGWLFAKAWEYYNDNTGKVVWPENL